MSPTHLGFLASLFPQVNRICIQNYIIAISLPPAGKGVCPQRLQSQCSKLDFENRMKAVKSQTVLRASIFIGYGLDLFLG